MDAKSGQPTTDPIFNDLQFEHRRDALQYIIENHGSDKTLIQPLRSKRSSNTICLNCDNTNCAFTITCYKSQKKNTTNIFLFREEESNLKHGNIDPNTNEVLSFCSGVKHPSVVFKYINIFIYLIGIFFIEGTSQ